MWLIFALLSALFAALTSIFSKIGLEGINSNLAVAIRTIVILFFAWGIVLATGRHLELPYVSPRNWFFLMLSGLATGASWLFFYRALQLGEVSRIVPIDRLSMVLTILLAFLILGEPLTPKLLLGSALIIVGVIIIAS